MGILEMFRDQFLDVIEYVDKSNKIIVTKFRRESGNNELKQGSKVIVREGQAAIFLKGGQLADVLYPGTYTLDTGNLPILSTWEAIPYFFTSPVVADLYFVSTKQFIDNKWATKNPIMKRDRDFNMVRIRAFGKFAFRISHVPSFMTEIFGSRGMVMTYDIVTYLASLVGEAFSVVVGESELSVLDFAIIYREFSMKILERVNGQMESQGIEFSEILIENISLPEEVEKLIDEQSGIGAARQDMGAFMQYQTARAMRELAGKDSGLAGLGAGMVLGRTMVQNIQDMGMGGQKEEKKSRTEQLRELKSLLDEGILTQEEFDAEKKEILQKG